MIIAPGHRRKSKLTFCMCAQAKDTLFPFFHTQAEKSQFAILPLPFFLCVPFAICMPPKKERILPYFHAYFRERRRSPFFCPLFRMWICISFALLFPLSTTKRSRDSLFNFFKGRERSRTLLSSEVAGSLLGGICKLEERPRSPILRKKNVLPWKGERMFWELAATLCANCDKSD